ncbi:MAG: DUF2865 domain-containing protein [Parafilimonas terrae]|nr:DUF2865 domain-containing protein [Parafilimonas terrae]
MIGPMTMIGLSAANIRARACCGFVLLAGAALLAAPPLLAQEVDCAQLRDAIATASRGDGARATQFARAAQQQQAELTRTQAYADQIGCNGPQIPFFGDEPPPQCAAIQTRINRMTGNLAALQGQARQLGAGDPGRQADLTAQYNYYCRTEPASGGYNDGGPVEPGEIAVPDAGTQEPAPEDQKPQGGSQAICVRTCDGGYFPLTTQAANGSLDGLQTLCSALCPNTEAKLYTTTDTDNISSAVALDGSAYTALPAAFKFQKTLDKTCTCKPPGKTWSEALAQAEQLLGKAQSGDVTVTEKISADMARPIPVAASAPRKKGSKAPKAPLADTEATALGALGAQAPTAGTDSAGISSPGANRDRAVKEGEGTIKDVIGPDGVKRRVRIVGPTL